MSTMTTRRAKVTTDAAIVLQKKKQQEMNENVAIVSEVLTEKKTSGGKKKEKKLKEKSPIKEVDENHDENLNLDENISPRTRTQRKKSPKAVAEKKTKGKKKPAAVPIAQVPEGEEEDADLASPVPTSSTITAKAETPSTPQKQRTQPQDPTLSASKSLARLNLFPGTEETTPSSKYHPFKSAATPTSLFTINPAVRKAYKLIQKATGALGGNGTTGAIYGELTMHSMQKVINFMIENCELTSASRFIDVGSGLGKPNVHAAQDPCCRVSVGIELEDIRWQLSMQNMKYLVEEMAEDAHLSVHADSDDRVDVKLVTGVNFLKGDIFDVATLDPFTHIYMYDLGFPPPLQQKIAEHFNESTHARYLVSYRPPRRVIGEYGYAVREIGKINTSMTGSGENHTAYFYQRTNSPAPCRARPNTTLFRIPPRPSAPPGDVAAEGEGEGELVVCSNKFLSCIKLAVGPLESCQAYVNDVTSSHLQSGRPKRDRKPRTFLDLR